MGRDVGSSWWGEGFVVALVLGVIVSVTGCATPQPRQLDLHVLDAPGSKPNLWPAAPDIPRYMYAGYLVGEENFRRTEKTASFFDSLRRWVFGEAPPNILQRPQGVAVDASERVLVSDMGRAAVLVFDKAKGELLVWTQAALSESFVAPSGIALGRDGDVFVSDPSLGYVARLTAKGEPVQVIGRGLLHRPTGVVVDPASGSLYVADTYNHVIREFSADGALMRTIGERGSEPGTFNFPTYLAMRDGELYVNDSMNARIQVLRVSDGAPLRSIGSRGTYLGQFGLPKGISLDSEGNLYVVESMYDYLLVFSREGEFLMGIGGNGQGRGQFYLPAGVWIDTRDRVLVSDMFNGRISVFQFLGGGDHRGFAN